MKTLPHNFREDIGLILSTGSIGSVLCIAQFSIFCIKSRYQICNVGIAASLTQVLWVSQGYLTTKFKWIRQIAVCAKHFT